MVEQDNQVLLKHRTVKMLILFIPRLCLHASCCFFQLRLAGVEGANRLDDCLSSVSLHPGQIIDLCPPLSNCYWFTVKSQPSLCFTNKVHHIKEVNMPFHWSSNNVSIGVSTWRIQGLDCNHLPIRTYIYKWILQLQISDNNSPVLKSYHVSYTSYINMCIYLRCGQS